MRNSSKVFKIVIRNLVFWIISFVVVLRLLNQSGEIQLLDFIYTLLFHIPLIIIGAFQQLALHKNFDDKKYWVYAFQTLILFSMYPIYYNFTFSYLSDWLFTDYYFVPVYSFSEMLAIGGAYQIITLLLHVSYRWVDQQEEMKKLAELKEQKRTAELNALRAQVNPHFLFNTLNTIYGETLKKSPQAPALVLQLSDMLRYVVDKSQVQEVPLKDEFEYIRNFVELQRQRFNRPDQITLEINRDPHILKIAPLILITFIENCFKHGKLATDKDFIHIMLKVQTDHVLLSTSNTISDGLDEIHRQQTSMGLANARRRLDLTYPDRYKLEQKTEDGVFYTSLNISLYDEVLVS